MSAIESTRVLKFSAKSSHQKRIQIRNQKVF